MVEVANSNNTTTVGIVGLGLIGGSLARRLTGRACQVLAWNHNPRPYESAERAGIICMPTLEALARSNPDIIVLCNPLKAMPDILQRLSTVINRNTTTLTDVGSVKGMVREQVKAAGLSDCYVGAHPMAGNELSGWAAADPALYDDALWALTVDRHTAYQRFLAVARMVVGKVGNRIIVLDDGTHDEAAALISHMPHAVSTAMINELVDAPQRNVAAALAAGSWRDMTRVALTDPDRTRAMIEEDSANVEALLRNMASRLTAAADMLHDMRETGGVPPEWLEFFSHGDPFRTYKQAAHAPASQQSRATRQPQESSNRTEGNHVLHIPADDWQQALLQSALRGEHVMAIRSDHEFEVRVTSAL